MYFTLTGIRRVTGQSDEIVWIKYARLYSTRVGSNIVNVENKYYTRIKETKNTKRK